MTSTHRDEPPLDSAEDGDGRSAVGRVPPATGVMPPGTDELGANEASTDSTFNLSKTMVWNVPGKVTESVSSSPAASVGLGLGLRVRVDVADGDPVERVRVVSLNVGFNVPLGKLVVPSSPSTTSTMTNGNDEGQHSVSP